MMSTKDAVNVSEGLEGTLDGVTGAPSSLSRTQYGDIEMGGGYWHHLTSGYSRKISATTKAGRLIHWFLDNPGLLKTHDWLNEHFEFSTQSHPAIDSALGFIGRSMFYNSVIEGKRPKHYGVQHQSLEDLGFGEGALYGDIELVGGRWHIREDDGTYDSETHELLSPTGRIIGYYLTHQGHTINRREFHNDGIQTFRDHPNHQTARVFLQKSSNFDVSRRFVGGDERFVYGIWSRK